MHEKLKRLVLVGPIFILKSPSAPQYLSKHKFENDDQTITKSRIELTTELSQYDHDDFKFVDIKHVFLSIAGCANGILTDRFVPIMLYSKNGVDSEIDITSSTTSSNEVISSPEKSDDEEDDDDNEPPQNKRQCNRMSVFGQSK